MLTHPLGERRVVEVVVLNKRDCGLSGFYVVALVLNHYFVTGAVFHLYVFAHHYARAEIHGKTHHESQSHLTHNLEFAFEAVLIVASYFQIIVGKSEASEPDGGEYHQEHIHVGEFAHK